MDATNVTWLAYRSLPDRPWMTSVESGAVGFIPQRSAIPIPARGSCLMNRAGAGLLVRVVTSVDVSMNESTVLTISLGAQVACVAAEPGPGSRNDANRAEQGKKKKKLYK